MTEVYLITMPYADVVQPSLSLGILKAELIRQGIAAKVCYANIWFAEKIGIKLYLLISNYEISSLLGDWTFAGVAFPDFQPDYTGYLEKCKAQQINDQVLWNVRNSTFSFVEQMVQHILAENPKIVGCSSTFQQHCASLALLKQIKVRRPEVTTILGGANCEGSMGYMTHQRFDWVDYVISGEAENLLPGLCQRILAQGTALPQTELPDGVYGPALRQSSTTSPPISRVVVYDLNASPIPLYDDYFDTLKASIFRDAIQPGLLFEASRGCWWGEKTACVFCGLNGDGVVYRSKSPSRVVDELAELNKQYKITRFQATDNVLDMQYYTTLLPALAHSTADYRLLFETRANVTSRQVKQLADAGVLWIQAGIENLHDNILDLLNKGTSSWQNVQLLKWCLQYGVYVAWNFLINLPGESVEWYHELMTWLPLLYHLQPPNGPVCVRYDRFSAFYKHPQRFNLELSPLWTYAYVYPLSPDQLQDFAYYFEDHSWINNSNTTQKLEVFHQLHALIHQWQELFYTSGQRNVSESRPMLSMKKTERGIVIKDTRPCVVQTDIILEGLAAEIYTLCDSAKTGEMIIRRLNQNPERTVSWRDIEPVLTSLRAQKILVQLQDRFLSLAIPEPLPRMPKIKEYPGGTVEFSQIQPKEIHPYKISLQDAYGITIPEQKC